MERIIKNIENPQISGRFLEQTKNKERLHINGKEEDDEEEYLQNGDNIDTCN